MKKNILIVFFIIFLCGCESTTNNKLETCCRYNGGLIENGKCVDYYSEYDLNNCLNEDDNAKYGASTKEGQERRLCCTENGGIVSNDGLSCSINKDDEAYLNNCLKNLK